MAVLAKNGRKNLWFGTLDRMQWVATPNSGADVSPQGWDAGGSTLQGGAFQLNSFNSAKNYVFEWPSSSSREAAQLMKSYADGTFGRGLIYFVDPLIYDTNILPAMWADPSMAVGEESHLLSPGATISYAPTTGNPDFQMPVRTVTYNFSSAGTMSPAILDDSNSVFLPIPEGFQLVIGVLGSYSGGGAVRCSRVSLGGAVSGTVTIPALSPAGTSLFSSVITPAPGEVGVRLWMGKAVSGAASVTLSALHARLAPLGAPTPGPNHWVGGQGHSGCRFSGKPTYMNHTGVNGGQVSYAATFREVGSWVVG